MKSPGPSGPAPGPPRSPVERIRLRSLELGFSRLGVCRADLPEQASLFRSWLERGFHGQMGWMARGAGKRLDPEQVLPGVRSILAGAFPYPGPEGSPPPGPRGEVSSYARGDDYHDVVGHRAAKLSRFMEESWGHRTLDYVDTGPILERMWGAQAGIGWVGKHSLILNKDQGSYFFLALWLTTMELPADPPALDECGSCNLCIEACPTGAIVEPRLVDSRRCISYHTIEKRGEYPVEFMEALGSRVFGCDDCQTACPWNQPPLREGGAAERFPPRPVASDPSLTWLAGMRREEYTRAFRGSAMKRATYDGLRRNAAVAMGNWLRGRSPGKESAGAEEMEVRKRLEDLARDENEAVAAAARWALDQQAL